MRGLLFFRGRPAADFVEIDHLRACHSHRLIKRLPDLRKYPSEPRTLSISLRLEGDTKSRSLETYKPLE
jgi:hypothetical protein